jgi:hypothetical protein
MMMMMMILFEKNSPGINHKRLGVRKLQSLTGVATVVVGAIGDIN